MKFIKKSACVLLSVALLLSVFYVSADDLTKPVLTQFYKTTGYNTILAFDQAAKENKTPYNYYQQTNKALPFDANGYIAFGGRTYGPGVMEFPHNDNGEDAFKYPSVRIEGTTRICDAVWRDGTFISLCSRDVQNTNTYQWASKYNGESVREFRGVKLFYSISELGFVFCIRAESNYYAKTGEGAPTIFENGSYSGGTTLYFDTDVTAKSTGKESGSIVEKNIDAGALYVKDGTVWVDFDVYYKDIYDSEKENYVTKAYLDYTVKYDVYVNGKYGTITNGDATFVETREASNVVELPGGSFYSNWNRNLGVGSTWLDNNAGGTHIPSLFKDITVTYDLAAYYKPAAEAFDNTYIAKIANCTTPEQLESLRQEYTNALSGLDENIRPYAQEELVNDKINKALADFVNVKYEIDLTGKGVAELTGMLNDFYEEYNASSDAVKVHINYNEIKEALEDAIWAQKSEAVLPTVTPEYSDFSYDSVAVILQDGYEYAAVRQDEYDWGLDHNFANESEREQYFRRLIKWEDGPVLCDLLSQKEYYLIARAKETATTVPGEIGGLTEFTTKSRPGDINLDNSVDAIDVSELISIIVNKTETEVKCDFNSDHTVNVADVVYLKRAILEYDGYDLF